MKIITHKKIAFLTIVVLILQIVLALESIVYSENDASELSLDEVEHTQLLNQTNVLNFEGQESDPYFFFPSSSIQETVEEPIEEVSAEEKESSDGDIVEQEDLKEQENVINEDQGNGQPSEEATEPVAEAPQEQQMDEEYTHEESEVIEPAVFDGETAEVNTMAEFREAVINPDIGVISVQANLTESVANRLTVDRPLIIQGNGYTLTFGINGFYFQLEEITETSTFRIENATLTKVGATPLINATEESSKKWTVELEDITEVDANAMRLALLPEGSIHFTGGVSNFTRTTSTATFIEAKEIVTTNQAEVTISRGNATVFFSHTTVADPKITVEQGAKVTITTTGGVANTIDLRGENPELVLQSSGQLSVATVGTTAAPTETTNNAIALTGTTPKITMNSDARMTITSTLAKRGIYLAGNDAQLLINNSELSATSATRETVNINGHRSSFSSENSTIKLVTTTGVTTSITGESPQIVFDSSTVSFTSTTGQRMNLIGTNPLVSLASTEMIMNASTGRGIYLQGETPQVLMENSQLLVTDTGASQGMILQGTDALLSLSNQSQLEIIGAGTGTTENIQIGNNNARPELSVTGESKVSVTTTSGTGAATDTANNAIHLRGADPKATVTGESELEVSITSGGRRSIFMNGESAILTVDNNSEFFSNNLYGTSIGMSTTNAEFTVDNFSEITIESSARRNNPLINIAQGSNNLSIKNNSSISTKHVEVDSPGNNTRALSMQGSNNNIRITSGGSLDINNTHYTNRPDSGSVSSYHAAVYLGAGNNNFTIDNAEVDVSRSQLRLINDYAAALFSDGGHLVFNQNRDTIFIAEGSSNNTQEWGVFVAGDTMEFNVNSPHYFDFKNVRKYGGDIFGTKNGSSLNITDTLFSAWLTGSAFDIDPEIGFFEKIDVAYEGRDFVSASSENNPNLSISLPGLSGRVSRISANNSRPIFDGFRQPTNADRSFIAEFSYEEGIDNIRKAGTNEITAEIKVTDSENNAKNYVTSTIGGEIPIQTWEEKEIDEKGTGGRVSFEFEDILKEGSTIEFVSISRGMNEGSISMSEEELELVGPITVMNITPPELVHFGRNLDLDTETISIEAFPNQVNIPGNNALLYVNKQYVETQKVKSDGSFSFDLKNKLNERDEVQILMEDNQGAVIDEYSTIENGFRRPETNNDSGNRNPLLNAYYYHDTIFPRAETHIVELSEKVMPVDPLDPESNIDPENKPDLPENQERLSIDFVSQFNFGSQAISVHEQTHYAQPQRLLNPDGTVNEMDERPNYVQISDRRSEAERNGWSLALTQREQFKGSENQELHGAALSLSNQQLVSAQGNQAPSLHVTDPLQLVPGNKRTLIRAEGNEGVGTWIYRFGDGNTARESVALHVPRGSNPEATSYSTTLVWELSAVPGN